MSSNIWAAVVAATGLWIIVGLTVLLGPPRQPGGDIWVVASSDKIASHPTLVRAALPDRSDDTPVGW